MMRWVRLAGVIALSVSACGGDVAEPRAQWVLHVRTDAPVPQLGDRVLVELLREDGAPACSGCRRLFGLASADAWPLSLGIPDPNLPVGALRLRLRLFRADHSDAGGVPEGGLPVDLVATLPPTGGDLVHVNATLSASCAGVAADPITGQSCDPGSAGSNERKTLTLPLGTGEGGPVPGSFPAARKTPCARAPRPGMICIEGGLFVRGEVRVATWFGGPMRSTPERLVRLSPFAIDETEMTVRDMRALVASGAVPPPVIDHASDPLCTYTAQPGAFEDHPMNCIRQDRAVEVCRARGMRLPSESEWEYAAGSRDEERLYPWGAEPDACAFAIIGRGRTGNEGGISESTSCRALDASGTLAPFGPRPVRESLDVTAQGVRDLGGNVAEWVLDKPTSYDAACNEGPPILVDPVCLVAPTVVGPNALTRGGDWSVLPSNASVGHRASADASPGLPTVGLRCVEPLP